MNRTRWILLLLLVPITIASQICTSSWPVMLEGVAASKTGPIYVAFSYEDVNGVEIWQWSRDLSQRRRVCRTTNYYLTGLSANADGRIIVCESPYEVAGLDATTGRRIWQKVIESEAKAHLLPDDRHLLLVEVGLANAVTVSVLDIETGAIIDSQVFNDAVGGFRPMLKQVDFIDDTATLQFSDSSQICLRYSAGGLQVLNGAQPTRVAANNTTRMYQFIGRGFWTSKRLELLDQRDSLTATRDVVLVPSTTNTPSTIRVVDAASGDVIHQDRLGISLALREALVIGIAIASIVWVTLLLFDSDASVKRMLINAATLVGFFTLPFIPVTGDMIPQWIVDRQWQNILAIPAAVLASVLFLVALGTERRLIVWAMLLFACLFPFLMPAIVAGVGLRTIGLRSPWRIGGASEGSMLDEGRLRFGISDLLLISAALAVFCGVGHSNLFLMAVGIGYTTAFLVSLLFSVDRSIARIGIVISTIAIVLCVCGGPWFAGIKAAAVCLLTFPFLRMHGFALRFRRRPNESQQTKELAIAK